MKLVDDGETCCHCAPVVQTTTETVATTGSPCSQDCIVPIDCDDVVSCKLDFQFCLFNVKTLQSEYRSGSLSIPFEINPECTRNCDCIGDGITRDAIWHTDMCLNHTEVCEDPCVVDGVEYKVS